MTIYRHNMPWWLKMFGVNRVIDKSIEANWGWAAFTDSRFAITLKGATDQDDQYRTELMLGFWKFTLVLFIPFIKIGYGKDNWGEPTHKEYGFEVYHDILWIRYGGKYLSWYIPFVHMIHDNNLHMTFDRYGNWFTIKDGSPHYNHPANKYEPVDNRAYITYDYTYTRKNGDVQKATAYAYKERRTWRRKWLPFLKTTRYFVWVDFDNEIGEGVDSWKGGVVGTGIDSNKDESILSAVVRMENTERFGR